MLYEAYILVKDGFSYSDVRKMTRVERTYFLKFSLKEKEALQRELEHANK